ncbi:hypothetical protein D9615_004706 [Tricholomella constricta]|uniref:Uncharacterized protein n=1 Tax=Tricholomella constricta TaxID=117010 RepID=A0A8H5M4M1_9AGAR|nr:hypothetical protein D9615_004706 [Tricholomella constricta]
MSSASSIDDAEKGILEKDDLALPFTLPTISLTQSTSPDSGDTSRSSVQLQSSISTKLSGIASPPIQPPALIPPLPSKKPGPRKVSRWIRFQLWFNTYRKFFTFVMCINFIGIVLAAAGKWQYPRHYTGACVLGNLLTAILMRNELFGRFLYLTVNTLFAKWPPLAFRLGCTSVLQHLGGIHSGGNHDSVLITGVVTNVIVGISIASAFPWVRNTHHNVFERHHRFMGWLGLLSSKLLDYAGDTTALTFTLAWIFVVLGDSYDLDTHSWNPDGILILRQQDFWFIFGMTIFVIIPWFTIREVKVDVEIPSPKVVILRFERGMQQGLLARISRGSVMEYHAFGIISEGKDAKEHYLICGVQGDFTRALVDYPPQRLWTRQMKFAGVSNTSTLYKRGIRVCTGTGLGAALSTCLQSPDW